MNENCNEMTYNQCTGCQSHYLSVRTGRTECSNGMPYFKGGAILPECYVASDEKSLATDDDAILFYTKATNDVQLVVKEYCPGLLHIVNSVAGPNNIQKETAPVVIDLENLPQLIKVLTAMSDTFDLPLQTDCLCAFDN